MKITKRQLRRIITEELSKINELGTDKAAVESIAPDLKTAYTHLKKVYKSNPKGISLGAKNKIWGAYFDLEQGLKKLGLL